MAGWDTNGLPKIGPVTANGVTAQPPNGLITNLASSSLFEANSGLASGQAPQTVAATAFQIAAVAMDMIANQATSTVHAATMNVKGGMIITEALSTAVQGTYTFTLTNSLVTTASAAPTVCVRDGTNTGGAFQITSVTVGSGTVTIVLTNTGGTALNGTILIGFHL